MAGSHCPASCSCMSMSVCFWAVALRRCLALALSTASSVRVSVNVCVFVSVCVWVCQNCLCMSLLHGTHASILACPMASPVLVSVHVHVCAGGKAQRRCAGSPTSQSCVSCVRVRVWLQLGMCCSTILTDSNGSLYRQLVCVFGVYSIAAWGCSRWAQG